MPNAKLLIEFEGVEAGGKECGKCRWREWVWQSGKHFCSAFVITEGGVKVYTRLEGDYLHPLRCPACLAAEEGEDMNPKADQMWMVVDEAGMMCCGGVYAKERDARDAVCFLSGGHRVEPVSVVRDGGKLAKKEG
jgi:hypothetical protein